MEWIIGISWLGRSVRVLFDYNILEFWLRIKNRFKEK